MAATSYRVLENVYHDNKYYETGSFLELDPTNDDDKKTIPRLLELNVIQEAIIKPASKKEVTA